MKLAFVFPALLLSTAASAQYYNPQPVNNGYYNTPKPAPAPQPYGYTAPDRQVNGYVKQNGTYVAPYHATTPDATTQNNYSTQGNYNPYTNTYGTKK